MIKSDMESFSSNNGEGSSKLIRIAILDHDIDAEMLEQMGYIVHSCRNNKEIPSFNECPGHGTRVIGTIEKYCKWPKEYFLYEIYNSEDIASERVISFLYELYKLKVDLVIMCFALKNNLNEARILEICGRLKLQGTILLAAVNNRGGYSIPADLEPVIGVGAKECLKTTSSYSEKYYYQIKGDVRPEFVKIRDSYCLFNGTSKATAITAALIINMYYENEGCGFFAKEYISKINKWFSESLGNNIEIGKGKLNENEEKIHNNVLSIAASYCDINKAGESIMFSQITNNLDKFGKIVRKVVDYYQMLDYLDEMKYNDFDTTVALARYIGDKNEIKKDL